MTVIAKTERVAHWATRCLGLVATLALFALMAMTFFDVLGRNLFNAPIDGATELTRLLMAILIFAVLPVVFGREENITVDLLDGMFNRRWANVRQALINLICALAMGTVAWKTWGLAERAMNYGDVTEYLLIPVYPFVMFIAVMCGLCVLPGLYNAGRFAICSFRS